MFARTLSHSYEVPVPLSTVWSYLTDPVAVSAQSTHKTWVEKSEHGFHAGTSWIEHHIDDCGSDPVRWVVRAVEAPRHFTVEGLQSGVRQRSTTTLLPTAVGTEVSNLLELSTSWRSRATLTERLVLPLVLTTGMGLTILAEGFEESVLDDERYLQAVAAGATGI